MGKQWRSWRLTHLEMPKGTSVAKVSVSNNFILTECPYLLCLRHIINSKCELVIKRKNNEHCIICLWIVGLLFYAHPFQGVLHFTCLIFNSFAKPSWLVNLFGDLQLKRPISPTVFLRTQMSSAISLNWLWITEVSLQVSMIAVVEKHLYIWLHVCVLIWVHAPHSWRHWGHSHFFDIRCSCFMTPNT